MGLLTRLKRSIKALLGLRQWPQQGHIRPSNFEEQIYTGLLRDGDVCIDVGAHLGGVALYLARLAGKAGCVLALEPVWPTYVELCRNVQLDTFEKAPIVTIPAGLAERVSSAAVSVPSKNFARGSLAAQERWKEVQRVQDITTYQCEFLTLDVALGQREWPTPQFVKIDVEGAELFVLRGATQSFARGFRPIMLIEVFAPWEAAFGYGPWDMLSYLRDLGYRFLFVCPEGLVEHEPSQESPFPREFERGYNVVAFILEKHWDRVELLRSMRPGGTARIMPMAPPPLPNRALPT